MLSFAVPAPVTRISLMRVSDALATQAATYAIPLLILVTTGSTALTGAAALARTLLCAAAACALAVPPAAGIAATTVVMTVGALPDLLLACAVLQGAAKALAFRGLWYDRASYAPSPTAADPAAAGHPTPAPADAPRAA